MFFSSLNQRCLLHLILITLYAFIPLSAQDSENNQTLETADSLAMTEAYEPAIAIYQGILDKREKTLSPCKLASIQKQLGHCYNQTGREKEAIKQYHLALKQKDVCDSLLLSDIYTGLGIAYEYTGHHDSAFNSYLLSYELIEPDRDTMRMARGLRNMAQILRVMKHFDEARKYCKQAIQLSLGMDDFKVLANIYNETAYLYELSDQLDSAGIYYQKLIDLSVSNGYKRGESVGYSNLASVYEREERYQEALEMKLYALEIDKEIKDSHGIMTSYVGLNDTYIQLGDYKKALGALEQAIQLCDTAWVYDLSGIHLGFYRVYKILGQEKKALASYEIHVKLNNRVRNIETEERVAEILTRYETEKKEQQISFLEQNIESKHQLIRLQWLLMAALIILTISLLIVGFLILKNKNHKLLQMETEIRNFKLIEQRDSSSKTTSDLTAREEEILHYLGEGYSNSAISEKLFISRNTVKYHIKNIYIKLDVKNRVEALIRSNGI